MLYAKVVIGLPVDGPFDYIVPQEFEAVVRVGSRVAVNFANRKLVAYVVGLSRKTDIAKLKSIIAPLDKNPLISQSLLALTESLSQHYCCSWGEALETALPPDLRKPRLIDAPPLNEVIIDQQKQEHLLVHDYGTNLRLGVYIDYIKQALKDLKSAVILFPEIELVKKFESTIATELNIEPAILYRHDSAELKQWLRIRSGEASVVVGTRSAVFAPLSNLGLIVIDDEQNFVYKQDQVPHYNAKHVAFERASAEGAKLILGSVQPSLESVYMVKQGRLKLECLRSDNNPEVKVVNMKGLYSTGKSRGLPISRYLQDAISGALSAKEKVLLLVNRTGFATAAICQHCGFTMRCPRCSVNLTYHYKDGILACHRCTYKTVPPKICPECNSGYIKYSGLGTEKMESELSRIFPQASVVRIDKEDKVKLENADIFIATKYVITRPGYNFDLVGVVGIDNVLSRVNLSSSEEAFGIISGLMALTAKKIVIQTNIPGHHVFKALTSGDYDLFYDAELKQRKQLGFPPYQHFAIIKVRGASESKVESFAQALFEKLEKAGVSGVNVISVGASQPVKLRGNFYWQILLKSAIIEKAARLIKSNLKNSRHSGLIVTVDIDPL